jgi:hypothetical protein
MGKEQGASQPPFKFEFGWLLKDGFLSWFPRFGPKKIEGCRMDLPRPTTSVGTRTDYSVGPWDYPACATRHLMAWSTGTTEEKYSVRKLYMSRTVWKTPRRTRLVLSPYSDL